MMEAYRAAADLEDQVGIETSLVVANYLLPEEYGNNAFFANRRAQQAKYLDEIRDRFDAPLMLAPLRQTSRSDSTSRAHSARRSLGWRTSLRRMRRR